MSNFTFLTEEQCFGSDKLDIFEKRGIKAAVTDFSMLLGGTVGKAENKDEHIDTDSSLEGRTGYYWTKSNTVNTRVNLVCANGNRDDEVAVLRICGARPMLPFSSISRIPTNGVRGSRAKDGILEVEYGHYPQKAVSEDMQRILEKAYKKGKLSRTGNTYTTDSINRNESYESYKSFKAQTHEEYEYNEKRYVRVEPNSGFNEARKVTLSNGKEYHNGDNVWIEVLPVKWLVDEKEKVMLTEKIIFAGVQFDDKRIYRGDFESTHIKRFMDEYFTKDLVQVRETGSVDKFGEDIDEGVRKSRLQKLNPDKTRVEVRSKMTDTEIIGNWIEAGESVLLRGPSGIGKTERIKSLYPDLIYMKLTNNMFPEKVVGSVNLQTGESIPPDFAKTAIMQEATEEEKKLIEENIQNIYEIADKVYERSKESDKKVVIMLDELLNVKPAVQSLVYTLVLNRMVEIGKGLKLPDNVVVVATGNQKRYSRVAEDLAEPLEKRFDHILDMEPKVGEWITEYAIPRKIHPTVIGYMMSKYASSMKSEAKEDIGYFYEEPEVGEEHLDENGCKGRTNDPRGWASISQMLYNFERNLEEGKYVGKNVEDILRRTIGSKLREEWAAEFYDYYNLPTLSPEEVVEKKYNQGDLPQDMNEKFAYMTALIGAKENEVEACRRFIKKHCDAECLAIYDIYWAGEDERRQEKISELENMQKHKKEEAEEFGKEGVKVYNEIGKLYRKFLAKSKDKEEENERI